MCFYELPVLETTILIIHLHLSLLLSLVRLDYRRLIQIATAYKHRYSDFKSFFILYRSNQYLCPVRLPHASQQAIETARPETSAKFDHKRERRWANCDLLLQLERRASMLRSLSLLLLAVLLQSVAPFSARTHGNGISLEFDREGIKRQLGYLPHNFVKVSARNANGSPVAIKTYPLDGGAPRRQA